MAEIVNKVATSGLVTIDLEDFIDKDTPRKLIDLKDHLFNGMILKENDFREYIKSEDWSSYNDLHVGVFCSNDAIIPTWAYMLITSKLQPFAKSIVFGDDDQITERLFENHLQQLDSTEYVGSKVVIKGCGDFHIPESCYMSITAKLAPLVSSLMYGEPCSTVPILKNRRKP